MLDAGIRLSGGDGYGGTPGRFVRLELLMSRDTFDVAAVSPLLSSQHAPISSHLISVSCSALMSVSSLAGTMASIL
jgi:hypothetical protein